MRGQMQFAGFAAWGCLAVLTVAGLTTVPAAHGQDGAKGPAPGTTPCYFGVPKSGERKAVGLVRCSRCHERSIEDSIVPEVDDDGFVLLNELRIWGKDDKHFQAYAVLLNDRSKAMAKRLGIVQDPNDPNSASTIHLDTRCLACHSSVPLDQIPRVDGHAHLASIDTIKDRRFNFGVSCEGCHGPSGGKEDKDNTGWGAVHEVDSPAWRKMSPQEKFESHGFWDIRSPRARSKICLSCHVGNVEQGKVVTHEMYAAGHPPLPSFELGGFVAQEPAHWRNLEDKPAGVRDAFLKALGEKIDKDELRQTRALLVSALMSVSESMRLNADLIEAPAGADGSRATWPELANFSCYACHHDLKRDGWRQARPRTSVPGRPTLHEWPSMLALIAAEVLDSRGELEKELDDVQTALNASPFGNNAQLLAATRKLAGTADALAVRMETHVLHKPEGEKLLKRIATVGATSVYDYDTARQLVWAYERIYAELLKKAESSDVPAVKADDVDLLQESENTAKALSWKGWMVQAKPLNEAQEILKSIESSVVLDLRTGSTASTKFPNEPKPRAQTDVDLDKTLPVLGAYDPATIQAAFKKLLEQPAP